MGLDIAALGPGYFGLTIRGTPIKSTYVGDSSSRSLPKPLSTPPLALPNLLHRCPAIENIPAEVKELNQWACFCVIPGKNGRLRKPPVNPRSGCFARPNDPSTWVSFTEAYEYYLEHRNDRYRPILGIGFMFSAGDPYCGIDWDEVFKEGKLRPDIEQKVRLLASYAEKSFSGTGVHVIVRAVLLGVGRNGHGIELYDRNHFFTFTGEILEGFTRIENRQAEIDEMYLALPAPSTQKKSHHAGNAVVPVVAATQASNVSGAEIEMVIKLLRKEKKAWRLFQGHWKAYPSHSDADLALCRRLAFYCRLDAGLMDAVFRRSRLYRDKWDQVRGSGTYGDGTIALVIADQVKVYDPNYVPTHYEFPSELIDAIEILGPLGALLAQLVYRKTVGFGKPHDWIAVKQAAPALKAGRGKLAAEFNRQRDLKVLDLVDSKRVRGQTHNYWRVDLAALEQVMRAGISNYNSTICRLSAALLDVARVLGVVKTAILQLVWRNPERFTSQRTVIDHRMLGDALGLERQAVRQHCRALMKQRLLSARKGVPPKVNLANVEELVRAERATRKSKQQAERNAASIAPQTGATPVPEAALPVQPQPTATSDAAGDLARCSMRPEVAIGPGQGNGGPTDITAVELQEFSTPGTILPPPSVHYCVPHFNHLNSAPGDPVAEAKTLHNYLQERGVEVKESVVVKWLSSLLPAKWTAVKVAGFLHDRGILKSAPGWPPHRAAGLIGKVLANLARPAGAERPPKSQKYWDKRNDLLNKRKGMNTGEYFTSAFGIDCRSYEAQHNDMLSAEIRRYDQQTGRRSQSSPLSQEDPRQSGANFLPPSTAHGAALNLPL